MYHFFEQTDCERRKNFPRREREKERKTRKRRERKVRSKRRELQP